MHSDQAIGSLLHPRHVEVRMHHPQKSSLDSPPTPGDPVPIPPGSGIEPGVEAQRHLLGLADRDVVRQKPVQPPLYPHHREIRVRPKMGHLRRSVHPRIRPTRGDERHLLPKQTLQALLNRSLNRPSVRLHLPTVIIRAFVFEDQLDIAQRSPPLTHCGLWIADCGL